MKTSNKHGDAHAQGYLTCILNVMQYVILVSYLRLQSYSVKAEQHATAFLPSHSIFRAQKKTMFLQTGLKLSPTLPASEVKQKSEPNSDIQPCHKWSQDTIKKCSEVWHLDQKETQMLTILQSKLSDVIHWKNNPFEVVRFLKESKGDLSETEHAFREMIKWRTNEKIDTMLESYLPPSVSHYFPAGIMQGVDRDGDPIYIERTGVSDNIGFLNLVGPEEFLKYGIWMREVQSRGKWQKEYEATHGHPVKHFTVVFDMQGLDKAKMMHSKLMAVGKQIAHIVQNYYAGYTKRIIVLRAPPIIKLGWCIFKPFIKQSMQDILIFTSPKDYRQVLEKYVDPKVMPSAIIPDGSGEVVQDFNPVVWEGGTMPKFVETKIIVENETLEKLPKFDEASLIVQNVTPPTLTNENVEVTKIILLQVTPIAQDEYKDEYKSARYAIVTNLYNKIKKTSFLQRKRALAFANNNTQRTLRRISQRVANRVKYLLT